MTSTTPVLEPTEAQKALGRIGAWAPGNYTCLCVTCRKTHIADKRAMHCFACAAADEIARLRTPAPAPSPPADLKERVRNLLKPFCLVAVGAPDISELAKAIATFAATLIAETEARLAPGHTDLMVTPESLDAFMEANPLPEEGPPLGRSAGQVQGWLIKDYADGWYFEDDIEQIDLAKQQGHAIRNLYDESALTQARTEGRKAGLEEAAKVADAEEAEARGERYRKAETQPDHCSYLLHEELLARTIARRIRRIREGG